LSLIATDCLAHQVSFQASPFEPPPPAEQLYVGAEANRYGELANPSSVGGDEMLRSDGRDPRTFTGRTVLNSGVILGQLPTLLAYLDWLLASAGPWCDQGRLNAFALAFPERSLRRRSVSRGSSRLIASTSAASGSTGAGWCITATGSSMRSFIGSMHAWGTRAPPWAPCAVGGSSSRSRGAWRTPASSTTCLAALV
jgi:hypothetical protein